VNEQEPRDGGELIGRALVWMITMAGGIVLGLVVGCLAGALLLRMATSHSKVVGVASLVGAAIAVVQALRPRQNPFIRGFMLSICVVLLVCFACSGISTSGWNR